MFEYIEYINPKCPELRIVSSLRRGGVSQAPYAELNLGQHVGDSLSAVADNRQRLADGLGLARAPLWLNQVHGTNVVTVFDAKTAADSAAPPLDADGVFCDEANVPCAIMTADCLPLVISTADASSFVCLHVGWRGLADGIIESGVERLLAVSNSERFLTAEGSLKAEGSAEGSCSLSAEGSADGSSLAEGSALADGSALWAWAGPCIGPTAFEVGQEVRDVLQGPESAWQRSRLDGLEQKWFCDLYSLVGHRLAALGVHQYEHAQACTFSEPENYFSYRRDGVTGRQATIAWRESNG